MKQHALLSASSAARWLACPPSAKLQEAYPESKASYAEEGTDAHSLCEEKLLNLLGARHTDIPEFTKTLKYFDDEMDRCTDEYADYVMDAYNEAKRYTPDALAFVEQRVDFSNWVPGGFGTADAIIVGEGKVHITDFKYGTGVQVSAVENPQMRCYALGVLELLDGLYTLDTIAMTIFQPRLENVSEWSITRDELLQWAENSLKPTAELAAKGEGEFCTGDHCRFCKAKHECRKRAEEMKELLKYEFRTPPLLEDSEVEEVLSVADKLTGWAKDIQEYALKAALAGKSWKTFKLVEGLSNRRFTDKPAVADIVQKLGKNPYKEPEILGLGDMEKLVGKENFKALLPYITKPKGKPNLVPVTDKKPAVDPSYFTTTADEFKGE